MYHIQRGPHDSLLIAAEREVVGPTQAQRRCQDEDQKEQSPFQPAQLEFKDLWRDDLSDAVDSGSFRTRIGLEPVRRRWQCFGPNLPLTSLASPGNAGETC